MVDKNYFEASETPTYYFIKLLGVHALSSFLFYLMYFVLLPKLLFKKRISLFIIAFLALVAFSFHTESFFWSGFSIKSFLHPEFINPWDQLYDITFISFFSVGIFLWDRWGILDERRKLLEHEVKESELKFLNSQLSPHFLFNTLNTIYGLSIYNSPDTSKAIKELKTTLNYIEKYNIKKGVVLGTEIANLKSYVAINNLRFDNNVNFDISVENPDINLEPMLFLPFIENAFKHGTNKKESEIVIKLEQKKDYLKFDIINEFSHDKRKDSVSGVGVENVKKRLSILYPNAKMSILKTDGLFKVFIHLKDLSN